LISLSNESLVFLKARKVAGTSLEIALSRYAGAHDILTPISSGDEEIREGLGFKGAQNYLDESGNKIFRPHMTAAEAKNKLGSVLWAECKKVSIVRNPFDVYVSLFFYQNGASADIEKLSDWYLKGKGMAYLSVNHKQYFIKGDLIIDHFVRYEYIKEDILELEKEFPSLVGLYNIFTTIKAKSGIRSNASYDLVNVYSKHNSLKKKIERLHDFEINQFCYSLE
jgi:hypothetical protein